VGCRPEFEIACFSTRMKKDGSRTMLGAWARVEDRFSCYLEFSIQKQKNHWTFLMLGVENQVLSMGAGNNLNQLVGSPLAGSSSQQ